MEPAPRTSRIAPRLAALRRRIAAWRLKCADADDSGKVEITDAIFLLGALFLGTNTIPAPYPACGADPTGDALGCGEGCR